MTRTRAIPSRRPPAPGSAQPCRSSSRADPQWYASNHGVPDWSIQRDDPAATTVELPPGKSAADVEAIKAVAVPVARTGANPAPAPRDYRIDVTSLNRGFFLGSDFLPGASFAQWRGSAVLTPAQPEAVIWQR